MRGFPDDARAPRAGPDRSNEGRVHIVRFVGDGDAAQLLAHGPIAVTSGTEGADYVAAGTRAGYEAAVIDRLVHAGYDTVHASRDGGQVVELRVTRSVVRDAEKPRKPVSGEAAMEVSNRGTAYGMAVNVDLTKPLSALVSTRLEARIRDRASGRLLWEGRADVATREGDGKWTDQEIAGHLADALFDGFPTASDGPVAVAPQAGSDTQHL